MYARKLGALRIVISTILGISLDGLTIQPSHFKLPHVNGECTTFRQASFITLSGEKFVTNLARAVNLLIHGWD
jgi:hypothetical protein